MPVKSAKQMRLMYSVLGGKSNKVPRSVAKEFIDKTSEAKKRVFGKQK